MNLLFSVPQTPSSNPMAAFSFDIKLIDTVLKPSVTSHPLHLPLLLLFLCLCKLPPALPQEQQRRFRMWVVQPGWEGEGARENETSSHVSQRERGGWEGREEERVGHSECEAEERESESQRQRMSARTTSVLQMWPPQLSDTRKKRKVLKVKENWC